MSEYIVFGLGRFGRNLATELQSLGNEVVGVDVNRQIVQDTADLLRQTIEADSTSEATLRELGVDNYDAAIVAIGTQEDSILTTLLLKRLGVESVIAKASSDLHGEILKLVGADRVVFPEKETALRLAHGIGVPEVVDYLSINTEMGVSLLSVPAHMIGQSYTEADIERRFHVRIIAVIRRDRVIFGGAVGERFQAEDVILVAGRDRDIRSLSQFIGKD